MNDWGRMMSSPCSAGCLSAIKERGCESMSSGPSSNSCARDEMVPSKHRDTEIPWSGFRSEKCVAC